MTKKKEAPKKGDAKGGDKKKPAAKAEKSSSGTFKEVKARHILCEVSIA